MHAADVFLVFTAPLDAANIGYMVSGSVASMIYGEPRLTNDIDLILHVEQADIDALIRAFPPDTFYCPPEEVITVEIRRRTRGHFNLIHHETGNKADMYLFGADPLHAWGFGLRKQIEIKENVAIWLAPPEYVILRKLEFYKEGHSEKHVDDIRGILEVSDRLLNRDDIDRWAAELGVQDEWAAVSADSG